jgi:hypothetical protein
MNLISKFCIAIMKHCKKMQSKHKYHQNFKKERTENVAVSFLNKKVQAVKFYYT